MKYLDDITEVVKKNDEIGVQHLVNSGYDINGSNNEFLLSSIHLAIIGGNMLGSVLKCEGDVNTCEWNLYTPLHYACITGKISDIISLINEGANVMAISQHQLTPLHLAARHNHELAIRELIKSGANINAKDHVGKTPLMLAAKYGRKKAAEELLISRCNMKETDERG